MPALRAFFHFFDDIFFSFAPFAPLPKMLMLVLSLHTSHQIEHASLPALLLIGIKDFLSECQLCIGNILLIFSTYTKKCQKLKDQGINDILSQLFFYVGFTPKNK